MLAFENFKSPNTKHDANQSVPHMQLNVFPLPSLFRGGRKAFILIETKNKKGKKQVQ